MTRIACFLQNAWSPMYAGRVWPRRSWLGALARSRSGKRLSRVLDDLGVCENVSPLVTAKPTGKPKPDLHHVRDRLRVRNPELVIACGGPAVLALTTATRLAHPAGHSGPATLALWEGPLLWIPHPASRVLTNALLVEARRMIEEGLVTRTRLSQRRGCLETADLPPTSSRCPPWDWPSSTRHLL